MAEPFDMSWFGDGQWDDQNSFLIQSVEQEEVEDLETKLKAEHLNNVCFQYLPKYKIIFTAFETYETALKAKVLTNGFKTFWVKPVTEEQTNQNREQSSLPIPPNTKNWLISPPPSPPPEWRPKLDADVNRVPHVDLTPEIEGDNEVLLRPTTSTPSIVVSRKDSKGVL
eukprot:TRINITY_DN6503_c0_g1_i1.p1 TRINITY_DN6503_c0_g1~~TRINITY_DN6503_c0_g1_i1.p1  ORF type:complete len:169 (+),score=34.41 TRINITY_DN6503_c0_g1_i1:77-583(+)